LPLPFSPSDGDAWTEKLITNCPSGELTLGDVAWGTVAWGIVACEKASVDADSAMHPEKKAK
jgi:hypothetical protein